MKKDRCRRCYTEFGIRKCLRHHKNIGWRCCNESRADSKCPPSCDFALRENADTAFPAFKAESRAEFQHLIRNYIDFWINQSSSFFENESPAKVAKDDSEAMLNWLSSYKFPAGFPIKYLMDRLALKNDVPDPDINDPEQIVTHYMNGVVSLEWPQIRAFTINKLHPEGAEEKYIQLVSAIPALKKIKTYDIVSAGISEDGSTAFVLLDLNHNTLWTMILTPREGTWQIRQNIKGSPQEYYSQNTRFTQIAETLGKGDEASAWHLIEEAKKIYPDSADIYYYSALHKQLIKQNDKAKVDFFSAIALDNCWTTPYFHLAALYLADNDFPEALYWYQQLELLAPEDPKVINNVAACYAGMKETARARQIWQGMLSSFPDFELARMNLEKLNHGL